MTSDDRGSHYEAPESATDSTHRRLRSAREAALRFAFAGRYQDAAEALLASLTDARARRSAVGRAERELTLLACTYCMRANMVEQAGELREWLRRGEHASETRDRSPMTPMASFASETSLCQKFTSPSSPEEEPGVRDDIDDDEVASSTRETAEQLERDSQTAIELAVSVSEEVTANAEIATLMMERGDFAGASRKYERAGRLFDAAMCQLRDSDVEACVAQLRKVSEGDPRYWDGVTAVAERLLAEDRVVVGAIRLVARLIRRGPLGDTQADMFHDLARLHARHGYGVEACSWLRMLLAERPSDETAKSLLAELTVSARVESAVNRLHTKESLADVPGARADGSPEAATATVVSAFGVGSTIGARYRLTRLIGHGGMAMVYQAVDLELDEEVALKVFSQPMGGMGPVEVLLRRFRHELKLSRTLAHPNIVRMYDIGIHEGHRYLTMELLRGQDLGELVETRLPMSRVLEILLAASIGLHAAHERGVVHRDVKPANIFVCKDGSVKLMDFGIAKSELTSGMTVSGTFAGTPAYMAPEQVRSFSAVGPAADQYSLGVVAYHLLAGAPPFEHDDMMALLLMQATELPPLLHLVRPDIPQAVEALILRMLEKDPVDRWPSCEAVAEQLRELIDSRQCAAAPDR